MAASPCPENIQGSDAGPSGGEYPFFGVQSPRDESPVETTGLDPAATILQSIADFT
jgi:hypothetical protein